MQSVSVRTAQNVVIQYPLASIGDRLVAYLIDLAILLAWTLLTSIIMSTTNLQGDEGVVVRLLVILLPWFCYQLFCETVFNGQSIGKRQMKIRVISLEGSRPSLGNYLLRWSLRIIDIMLNLGSIAIMFISASNKGQRLGDIAAGTTVIKLQEPGKISGQELFRAVNEEHEVMYSEASKLSDRDVQTIREAIGIYKATGKFEPVTVTDLKVREVLGINPEQKPLDFLPQLVKDHIALATANL
ncbi:MAG TPA: RDD family protein [Cytophagales bacterium]|nr:RDD family protein [Cytophagales bacterium]HAA24186.1 RDD family protein [Cytophagales bacterium]HAP60965.1 RDD family protein [Cytophagales bacterium]